MNVKHVATSKLKHEFKPNLGRVVKRMDEDGQTNGWMRTRMMVVGSFVT